MEVRLPLRASFDELFASEGGRYVLQYSGDGSPFYLWEGRPQWASRETLDAAAALIPGQPLIVRVRLWLARQLLPRPYGFLPRNQRVRATPSPEEQR